MKVFIHIIAALVCIAIVALAVFLNITLAGLTDSLENPSALDVLWTIILITAVSIATTSGAIRISAILFRFGNRCSDYNTFYIHNYDLIEELLKSQRSCNLPTNTIEKSTLLERGVISRSNICRIQERMCDTYGVSIEATFEIVQSRIVDFVMNNRSLRTDDIISDLYIMMKR